MILKKIQVISQKQIKLKQTLEKIDFHSRDLLICTRWLILWEGEIFSLNSIWSFSSSSGWGRQARWGSVWKKVLLLRKHVLFGCYSEEGFCYFMLFQWPFLFLSLWHLGSSLVWLIGLWGFCVSLGN